MPFGPYKDFEDCVRQNQDKEDPEAFCAWLEKELTGKWPGQASKAVVERAEQKAKDFIMAASSIRLNEVGFRNARQLIRKGQYTTQPGWEFTADDGNKILGDPPDWDEYAKWFLGIRADTNEETKEHYAFPFGKNGKVYRSGLIAAKVRAAQIGNSAIYNAADSLIEMIDKKEGKEKKSADHDFLYKEVEFKVCQEEERLVGGLVLVPGEVDSYGDYWTPEDIRQVSQRFMQNYRLIDKMHTTQRAAIPVESIYLPTPEEGGQETYKLYGVEVPAGSWWLTVRVLDDESWQMVKDGKLTGFSIFAVRKAAPEEKETVPSSIRHMKGSEWEVTMVALVDRPAVPKAQFYVVRRAQDVLDFISYAGRTISDATLSKLRAAWEAIGELIGIAEKERKRGGEEMPEEKEQKEAVAEKAEEAVEQPQETAEETVAAKEEQTQAEQAPDVVELIKALGEQVTNLAQKVDLLVTSMQAKEIANAVAEQVSETISEKKEEFIPEEVVQKLEKLEATVKRLVRTSNKLLVSTQPEVAAKSEEEEESQGALPSWANIAGGPRK